MEGEGRAAVSAYVAYIHTRLCLLWRLHECFGPLDAAHVKSHGAGGRLLGNLVPLCRKGHDELHAVGTGTFETKYGIDLAGIARNFAQGWRERHPDEPDPPARRAAPTRRYTMTMIVQACRRAAIGVEETTRLLETLGQRR